MLKKEIWRPVNGFAGYYEVSNFGNVRSINRKKEHNTAKCGFISIDGKLLKQAISAKGYRIVYLSKHGKMKTVRVHRLVALAFLPQVSGKNQVNHIDGNKQNNRLDNLEWCNNSENQIHAWKHGLRHFSENAGRKRKPVIQKYLRSGEEIQRYNSIAGAARALKINGGNLRSVCNGLRHSCGGYAWEYENGGWCK